MPRIRISPIGNFSPTGCRACPNHVRCESLQSLVRTVHTAEERIPGFATTKTFKSFATVMEHLRRHGFRYPVVENYKKCWLHDKSGVIHFYEERLTEVVEGLPAGAVAAKRYEGRGFSPFVPRRGYQKTAGKL